MKKLIIIIFFLLLAITAYADDTKLVDMTLLSSADCGDDELIYVTDDPNGTPVDRKIARFEFLLGFAGSTNIVTLGTIATGTWEATAVDLERGGLGGDFSGASGILAISGGSASEVDSKSELEAQIADVADFAEADGDIYTNDHDYGGADLEIPQGQTPDTDGDIDLDFTDGKLVIQHGSAHAELAGSTDVVMGSLIKSWDKTVYAPDGINDVFTFKAINSIEFPHGVVITAIYLGVSEDSNYVLTVQNFDDFDTINAGDPTIDVVTYTADTTGEIIDSSPTFATIAAGQLIMVSIPATDVDWIHIEIYYYEPIA